MANDAMHFSLETLLSVEEYKWFVAYFERQTESGDPPLYVWDFDEAQGKLTIDIHEHRDLALDAMTQVVTLLQNMIRMKREATGEAQPTSQEEDDAGSSRNREGVVRADD